MDILFLWDVSFAFTYRIPWPICVRRASRSRSIANNAMPILGSIDYAEHRAGTWHQTDKTDECDWRARSAITLRYGGYGIKYIWTLDQMRAARVCIWLNARARLRLAKSSFTPTRFPYMEIEVWGTTPFRSKARWVKLLISLERHFRNLDRVEDPKRFH